jgi:hypothetical protein
VALEPERLGPGVGVHDDRERERRRGDRQLRAVGAEGGSVGAGHGGNLTGRSTGGDVHDTGDAFARPRRREQGAVRAERRAPHGVVRRSLDAPQLLAGGGVPRRGRPVVTGGGEDGAVVIERHVVDVIVLVVVERQIVDVDVVAGERPKRLARTGIADVHEPRLLGSLRDEHGALRAPVQGTADTGHGGHDA